MTVLKAGWDDGGSAQLSAVSKEQLYGMLAKMRARYHKYKGRYVYIRVNLPRT